MKRGFAFILGLFLLSFVSAQFFSDYGSYGSFSITGFFDSINPQDITLLVFFIVIFAFLFFVLTRINLFRDAYGQPNKAIPGVISFAISLLSVYGIYRSDFDLEGLFSGFGISSDIFNILIWVLVIGAFIFLIWIFGKRKNAPFSLSGGLAGLFFTSGVLIMLAVFFTDFFYEKGVALVIGGVMILIGLWLWKRTRRSLMGAGRFVGEHYNWEKEKGQAKGGTLVLVLGVLMIIFGIILSGNIIIILIGIALSVFGVIRMMLTRGIMWGAHGMPPQ